MKRQFFRNLFLVSVICSLLGISCASSGGTAEGPKPLAKWSSVANPTFGTSYIRALYFDGSRFFAAGDRGAMAYSDDGVKWTPVDSRFDGVRMQSVVRGNNRYLAVGDEGKMSYSDNGTGWTAVPGIAVSKILVAAYGSGVFVIGGSEGPVKMMYSADGIGWTQCDSTFGDSDVNAIAYGDGKFVAAGTGGRMAYSADGINWTAVADSGFGKNVSINAVVHNGIWSAGGSAGAVAVSPDGINWTAVKAPPKVFDNRDIRRMTCGNGKFLTGGAGGIMAWSADGVNWEPVNYTFEDKLILSLAYGKGKFVAGGQDGKMAYTVDE